MGSERKIAPESSGIAYLEVVMPYWKMSRQG
jgi:hypothetical protein